jgi:hypothetical protein
MHWVRCPSCRTFNDVHRYAMCDGCNRDLTGVAPVGGAVAPFPRGAVAEARADQTRSSTLLAALAVLGGLGLAGASGGLLLIPLLIYLVLVKRNARIARSGAHRVFIRILAVLGAVFSLLGGIALLLFFVCVASLR